MKNIKKSIRYLLKGEWLDTFLKITVFICISGALGLVLDVMVTDLTISDKVAGIRALIDITIGTVVAYVILYLYSFRDKILEWTEHD